MLVGKPRLLLELPDIRIVELQYGDDDSIWLLNFYVEEKAYDALGEIIWIRAHKITDSSDWIHKLLSHLSSEKGGR